MYCKYCGTKLRDNAKFCKSCGKKVVIEEKRSGDKQEETIPNEGASIQEETKNVDKKIDIE